MDDSQPQPPAQRRREHRLVRWQAITGLVFGAFLLLHLVNVMASVFGPGLYDAVQVRIRPLYQQPLVELGVLLTALVTHIAIGIARIRRRGRARSPGRGRARSRWARLPLRARLHRASAYFLLVFIFGHIAATRLPTLLDGIWLGFDGVAYAMVWVPGFFYPYYVLLGLCGLYHGSYGVYLSLRLLGVRLPPVTRLRGRVWVPLAIASVLVVLGVLSFGGQLYAIDDPSQGDFARFVAERFGM